MRAHSPWMTSGFTITWQDECAAGGAFHIARHQVAAGAVIPLHAHGFSEVFWIEAGAGGHLIGAGEEPLRPGDAGCVAPEHVHGFRAGPAGLTLVNVSFPTLTIAELAAPRYAPWPWEAGRELQLRRLNPVAMERLHSWTGELSRPGAGRLDIDAFLLDLVRMLARGSDQDGLPPQLEAACTAFMVEGKLITGTPGLARLVGCTPEHLNRMCRRWHGCTASDLVARLRIEWAARELRLTVRPIAAIAEASGMPHLGHFYRRFKERYGTTPKAWRAAAWGMFSPVQP